MCGAACLAGVERFELRLQAAGPDAQLRDCLAASVLLFLHERRVSGRLTLKGAETVLLDVVSGRPYRIEEYYLGLARYLYGVKYDPDTVCMDGSGRREYCGPQAFHGEPDIVYRNNGDFTFTDVTADAGLTLPDGGQRARGLGVICADCGRRIRCL